MSDLVLIPDYPSLLGDGSLSGFFNLGTLPEGINYSDITIRAYYIDPLGGRFNGLQAAQVNCQSTGQWLIGDLNGHHRYNVVISIPGYNDIIYSNKATSGLPPYVVFTTSGSYLVPEGITEVDVLIVAGGGGGGSRQGGGGGAGGLQIATVSVTPFTNIPVVVGLGGQGGSSGGRGFNGGNSSFGSLTSIGGGGGGGRTANSTGTSGGSGGGGASGWSGGGGVVGQGNDGGNSLPNRGNLGGGGGGASQPGSIPSPTNAIFDYEADAGSGGDGIYIPELTLFGDVGWFAGGGGGGGFNTLSLDGGGIGGLGGGGKGHGLAKDTPPTPSGPGESGLPNTGGGGGGSSGGDFLGGNGGSGIVIIMSPAGQLAPTLNSKRALTVIV